MSNSDKTQILILNYWCNILSNVQILAYVSFFAAVVISSRPLLLQESHVSYPYAHYLTLVTL